MIVSNKRVPTLKRKSSLPSDFGNGVKLPSPVNGGAKHSQVERQRIGGQRLWENYSRHTILIDKREGELHMIQL